VAELELIELGVLALLQPVDLLYALLVVLGLAAAYLGPPMRSASRAGIVGDTLGELVDYAIGEVGHAVLARLAV
jgi:hypothetical protein